MTAFRTASTGTAIAILTGAAKISAFLAAICIPEAAVAGYFAHDKIKSEHKKSMARKAKAQRLEATGKIYFT